MREKYMFINNIDMEELFNKYHISIFKNVSKENLYKIICFLESEQFYYIDEIVLDYFDLFLIDYEDFIKKYELLKKKYGYSIVEKIAYDMSILEELLY